MIGEYIFPASVASMKFGLRLLIDQEVRGSDFAKAVMAFPVDISFLAFTFGSATIVAAVQHGTVNLDIKSIMTFIVSCAAVAIVVIFLAKRSDRAFDADRNLTASLLTTLSYAVALMVAGYSAKIGVPNG